MVIPRIRSAIRQSDMSINLTTNGTSKPPRAKPLPAIPVAIPNFLWNQLAMAVNTTVGLLPLTPKAIKAKPT